jgi:hypothetical protein
VSKDCAKESINSRTFPRAQLIAQRNQPNALRIKPQSPSNILMTKITRALTAEAMNKLTAAQTELAGQVARKFALGPLRTCWWSLVLAYALALLLSAQQAATQTTTYSPVATFGAVGGPRQMVVYADTLFSVQYTGKVVYRWNMTTNAVISSYAYLDNPWTVFVYGECQIS